ncbi:MAG: 2-phospho-L-lactate guanylyltransferase [Pseudomonadota bacterium]
MTGSMVHADCLVAVPMKDPARSKTRLSDAMAPEARHALARYLFKRTLELLREAQRLAEFDLVVVTGSEQVTAMAGSAGVSVLDEGPVAELSAAATRAAAWAAARGYRRFCVIPADLANPRPQDLAEFIGCPADAAICPSTDLGTNAILVSPPTAIRFAYGPRSATAHIKNAKQAGLTPRILPFESLRFDIDTSNCLEQAMIAFPELCNQLGEP